MYTSHRHFSGSSYNFTFQLFILPFIHLQSNNFVFFTPQISLSHPFFGVFLLVFFFWDLSRGRACVCAYVRLILILPFSLLDFFLVVNSASSRDWFVATLLTQLSNDSWQRYYEVLPTCSVASLLHTTSQSFLTEVLHRYYLGGILDRGSMYFYWDFSELCKFRGVNVVLKVAT